MTDNLHATAGPVERWEEPRIERVRRLIEEHYLRSPTGCGGSFGEILCFEIHSAGQTFVELAEKWGISLPTLGELVWDHCKRLEAEPFTIHEAAAPEPGGAKGAVPLTEIEEVLHLVELTIKGDRIASVGDYHQSAAKTVRAWLSGHPSPAPERRFALEDKAALMYAADLASFWGDGKNLSPVFSRHGAKGVAERLRRMLDEATR